MTLDTLGEGDEGQLDEFIQPHIIARVKPGTEMSVQPGYPNIPRSGGGDPDLNDYTLQ